MADSARKRLTDPVQSPSKRTRDGHRTPKKQAMVWRFSTACVRVVRIVQVYGIVCPMQNYVREGDGEGPADMDQESIFSRDTPTSSLDSKRYNLRGLSPYSEAASSFSPRRLMSGQSGKTRQRKNPNPKVLVRVCEHTLVTVCVLLCCSMCGLCRL